jgi:hypothetical protein
MWHIGGRDVTYRDELCIEKLTDGGTSDEKKMV